MFHPDRERRSALCQPNGTHFRKFAALLCLHYGPAKAGFRLKAGLQTSTRVFVVPSFSRNAALFDYTASPRC